MKTAVITGCRGQTASYLSELLLDKGYTVVGLARRTGTPDYCNMDSFINHPNFIFEQADITDSGSLTRILNQYKHVDEFYNLAAQSFVGASWDEPVSTCQINYIGVCNCLESIRLVSPNTKFFQASTSEVYGDVVTSTQNEDTPARPRSPYGASKYAAESLIKVYRESYGTYACFARAFNHESPRRGKQFVTRKITNAIGEIVNKVTEDVISEIDIDGFDIQAACEDRLLKGIISPIKLGNLEAKRDWSHAKDIVRGIWLMMQGIEPDDYVLASGKTRSIREFLDAAFNAVGIHDWTNFVEIDPKFYRPAEVNVLCGDATKAHINLEWYPEISFNDLVREMVETDVQRQRGLQFSRV